MKKEKNNKRRLTMDERSTIYQLLTVDKLNDSVIAKMFGVTSACIAYHRQDSGIPLNKCKPKPKKCKWTQERMDEVRDLWEATKDKNEVARHFGIKVSTLHTILTKSRARGLKVPYLYKY